jgi:site-specific DNA-methyltransferase (adenine-specific)/modification methylase
VTYQRKEIIGDCTLYQGDCLEVMPGLGEFDAVVTDPPYGIGESNARGQSRGRLAKPRQYVGADGWDAVPASSSHINAMRSMSRHQIIFGGNYFDGLGPTTCWLIWDKQNGENDFADCEMAWTNLSKAVRRIYWRWNGMIRKGDDVREHPTQKPIGVMEWCIQHLPADANTILDPFMGSGTTGVACVNLGRKFTGIELDPQYFDVACRRIEEAYKQPRLFEEPAPKPVQEQIRFDGDAA